jgi:hypothetical protein
VRRQGHQTTKSFITRKDAEAWAREMEIQADRQALPQDPRHLERFTLGDLVIRYRDTVTPRKKSAKVETIVLNAFRRLMEARMQKMGRREYVQVLRLLETFGFEDLHAAVRHALRLGAVSFDAVKHLLLCRIEKRPPKLDLDIYPYLPRANVATTSPASYMSLMTEAQP